MVTKRRLVLGAYLAAEHPMLPYGCAAMSSYIRHNHPDVGARFEFRNVAFLSGEPAARAAEEVIAVGADVVGLSLFVWNRRSTLDLAKELHHASPSTTIIVGGPHVHDEDAELLELVETGVVATAVEGEGEVALARILGDLLADRFPPKHIQGGSVDLDACVSPYRLEPEMRAELANMRVAVIEGARGCPYTCAFCDQGWRPARTRDLKRVLEDLAFVQEAGAERVIFLDPTFNQNHARMEAILTYVRDEMPGTRVSAEVKVHTLRDSEIRLLGETNATIEIGLQTSNAMTLERIRRPEKLPLLWAKTRDLVDAGVEVFVNTIYGLPAEGIQDWLDTLDDCFREVPGAVITSTCLKLLPNTQIYAERTLYGYDYEIDDLCRVTGSNSMSAADFEHAARLSKLLAFLQQGGRPISSDVRRTIDSTFASHLSAFLEHFNGGSTVVTVDGRRVLHCRAEVSFRA